MAGSHERPVKISVTTSDGSPRPPEIPPEIVLFGAILMALGIAVSLLAAFLLKKWEKLPSIWLRSACAALIWPLAMFALLVVFGLAVAHVGLGRALSNILSMPWQAHAFFAVSAVLDWLAVMALFGLMQWRAQRRRRGGFDVFS